MVARGEEASRGDSDDLNLTNSSSESLAYMCEIQEDVLMRCLHEIIVLIQCERGGA